MPIHGQAPDDKLPVSKAFSVKHVTSSDGKVVHRKNYGEVVVLEQEYDV